MIRQPIVVIAGHIDHGKSSILEKVKGISITRGESGGITQSIKSYNVPIKAIERCCGPLLKKIAQKISIPGLLFLDSPGHAAFNNMRKLGGNLADIAILTIDINEGMKDQTLEVLEIFKQYKTPFIIALNKIDLIPGWRSNKDVNLLEDISGQSAQVQTLLDTKLYEILGKLSEHSIDSERFDRVSDYTKQVAMVPLSAKTEEGLPELLVVLTGLAQKYLEESLKITAEGEGKATILEVQEDPGVGTTLDIILYDGKIKKGDQIVVGSLNGPVVTKVRGLFEPFGKKLVNVNEIHAAYGVRVCAPALHDVVGGMPLVVANTDLEKKKNELKIEVESVLIDAEHEGVVVKADTLGSLEALIGLLKKEGIKIKKASIGNITKKDLATASSESEDDKKAILGFNVKTLEKNPDVKIITNQVIYKIIEDYSAWKANLIKQKEAKDLERITRPVKITILRGHVFRQSNPCVVGVHIESGTLKTEAKMMKVDGSKASYIKEIQEEGKNVNVIGSGKDVAVSLPNLTAGRQIKEGDYLYSDMSEVEFRALKEMRKLLKKDEIETLKVIAEIKRKINPTWGV